MTRTPAGYAANQQPQNRLHAITYVFDVIIITLLLLLHSHCADYLFHLHRNCMINLENNAENKKIHLMCT